MTKKEKALFIIKTLDEKGYKYKVLSKSGSTPNHIRVDNFGDIWPSTGTFHKDKVWHKRSFDYLIRVLGGSKPDEVKKGTDRVEELEKIVESITERLEQMDEELDALKGLLCL